MSTKDFVKISLWIVFPLFIMLNVILSACSPYVIKEAEEVTVEIIEHIAEEELEK